jgi:hypothetical protein
MLTYSARTWDDYCRLQTDEGLILHTVYGRGITGITDCILMKD